MSELLTRFADGVVATSGSVILAGDRQAKVVQHHRGETVAVDEETRLNDSCLAQQFGVSVVGRGTLPKRQGRDLQCRRADLRFRSLVCVQQVAGAVGAANGEDRDLADDRDEP